ncbi:N-acetyltransferase [Rhodanobacter sp. Root627]|uniref:GNAT family N-acetyltransferase n=1 Tax=Rhodanobacter sp. Root627 TaxID=1736572 RepID=UPI0009E753D7|nr:N-acetyltransferase [Rhodanobacter sp. Root627]
MQHTLPSCIEVRRAAPSDLDALVALEQHTFDSDQLSRAQYRRHLASDSALVLVVDGAGPFLAGAAVVFFRKGSVVARLYSLATAAEARGKGVASALMAATTKAARDRGCRVLRLEVRADNVAAIGLYERQGYRRIDQLPGYYEDGAEGWRYERVLGNLAAETS